MTIREHLKRLIVSFTREVLAMWFAFRDRRVRWYVKLVLLAGVAYVVSPYDLIPDIMLFWGEIDDIIVLRITYVIARKIIDPVILDECRAQASNYLDAGLANKMYFVSVVFLIWGIALLLSAKFVARKLGKL